MIPVLFIEEHNEAFLCWNRFVRDGIIPQKGNYLLHIDHHDDLEAGGYRFDPNRIPDSMEAIEHITYNDLGIANFIYPAVHQGIFSAVHILKNLVPVPVTKKEMLTVCTNGKSLGCADYVPFIHAEKKRDASPGYRFFTRLDNGLGDGKINEALVPDCGYVLDIDLDYFCWDDSLSTRNPKRIEITEDAYREYCGNRYHPFRILPVLMLRAIEDGGKYYLEYREELLPDSRPTEERILKRVTVLSRWLEAQNVRPAAIDLCTSRFSGYLPDYAYPFVKDALMKELKFLQE